ncbi:MAG: NAD(P)/FAD-dependent oxidoreductase [Gammaproteobacteria bacterium]|nr:NAD(P)/FAD-dependent oxidoreductase [Gammaproteobacteria bacterium]
MNSSSRKPPTDFDALIIGAGHNGLVCAAYLARAGLRVGVFERRSLVGGAAVTEEFVPGFRNSTASYTVSLLNPQVIRDLRLTEHGLCILERPMQNFLPLPNGDSFSAGPDSASTLAETRRYSAKDAACLPEFYALLNRAVAMLRSLLTRTPPTDLRRGRDLWEVLRVGRDFRAMPISAQRELYEFFTRSAGEILDHWFECEPLKALFGFDSVVGSYASPYTPGSAYVLLHHAFGEVNGKSGIWGHAVGGMGAITQALATEARQLGVHIECDAPVANIITTRGRGSEPVRATGIKLADGRVFGAPRIIGNLGPKPLFLSLLSAEDLPQNFRGHIERWRVGSATFRMNVALSALPNFNAQRSRTGDSHLGAGIIIAPSLGYMDRAYATARLHGISRQPIVEMLIPSTLDDTLAPKDAHVASLFCQHFDYDLGRPDAPDRSWRTQGLRDAVAEFIIDTVNDYAPNFRASVIGHSALSPLDLEDRFALARGDIFHGALGLDQLWAARPALGYGDYRTPVRGLYLCGSGAHPGGGVTGVPGMNAAREILRDNRR